MATELRTLLRTAGIPGPYVFAGHSMGAVNVQLLGGEHQSEVSGMVLIDAMTSDQVSRFWAFIPEAQMDEFRAGLSRLPEGINFDTLSKGLAESKAMKPWLRNKPLVVLARGKEEGFPGASAELKARMLSAWQSAQADLSLLSNNRAYVVAKESGHAIHRDAPALVVAAIREVVESARSRRALDGSAISGAAER